ncbi:MAG: phosphate/phosphite/phosphonate ABC transporter substrate-binding protein [Deltaproteobacteria bacterium]|nr:phosphate/phosphite/phosphonate ABC transporter substrate-binding protein [Deltaproteobacteria bacterium]
MRTIPLWLLLWPVLAGAQAPPQSEIVFGMTPVVGPEHTRQRFSRVAEYLSEQLGMPVRLVVTSSYGELIDKTIAGEVDLAKLSPLAYVRARRKNPDIRLIASHVAAGSVNYSSYLIALASGPFASLDRIRGARLCFVDPDSTSGFLFPADYLQRRSFDLGKDFQSISFGGDHRACLEGLFAGRYDLVATWAGAIRDARSGGMDAGELVIVAKTGRIPYDAYCLRPGFNEGLGRRLKAILLDLNTLTRTGRHVLAPTLGINGWVEGDDRIYDGIRNVEQNVRSDRFPDIRPATLPDPTQDGPR